jgi:hypothetical protein
VQRSPSHQGCTIEVLIFEDVVEVVFGLFEFTDRRVVHAPQRIHDHLQLVSNLAVVSLPLAVEQLETLAVTLQRLKVVLFAKLFVGLHKRLLTLASSASIAASTATSIFYNTNGVPL